MIMITMMADTATETGVENDMRIFRGKAGWTEVIVWRGGKEAPGTGTGNGRGRGGGVGMRGMRAIMRVMTGVILGAGGTTGMFTTMSGAGEDWMSAGVDQGTGDAQVIGEDG